MAEYGTKLEHYCTPRIIIISDGEASDPEECEKQIERAKKNHIIIDCIALLSEYEAGEEMLRNIAESTFGYPFGSLNTSERGQFILPDDIQSFFNKLTVLANKKVVTKQEDTILCLDLSGSMKHPYRGSKITKINALKEAVEKFIDFKKADPRDRIAVVACGGYWAKNLIELTIDKEAIMEVVRAEEPFGGSPLGQAIKLGINILNWENRSENFKYEDAIPLFDFWQIPSNTICSYCEITGAPNTKIDSENFKLLTGKYDYGAWQCPKCKSFFHGFCFTGKGFTNGENGICYKCTTPLKIPINEKSS
jgi:uncharacterized protein YegL